MISAILAAALNDYLSKATLSLPSSTPQSRIMNASQRNLQEYNMTSNTSILFTNCMAKGQFCIKGICELANSKVLRASMCQPSSYPVPPSSILLPPQLATRPNSSWGNPQKISPRCCIHQHLHSTLHKPSCIHKSCALLLPLHTGPELH